MSINTVKALSFIVATAATELTILEWITLLNTVYPQGIPENAKMTDVIHYFADKFPNFEERSNDDYQEAYDKLYEDYINFILTYGKK